MSLLSGPPPGVPRPEPSQSPGSTISGGSSNHSSVGTTNTATILDDLPAVATVPMQLIYDCKDHVVSLELVSREVYRGRLVHYDRETMNLELCEVTLSRRDGEVKRMESVFLRGNKIRFVRLPDVAEKHPVFKELKELETKPRPVKQLMGTRGGRGRGRGRGGVGGRAGPPRPQRA